MPCEGPRGIVSVRPLRLRVNVWLCPYFFSSEKIFTTPLQQPLSLSVKDFILATHPTMQYHIGPLFQIHVSKDIALGVVGSDIPPS